MNNRSVIYPSLTTWGKTIVTCITYDPPVGDLPVGSKNKVCNNQKNIIKGLIRLICILTLVAIFNIDNERHQVLDSLYLQKEP